MGEELKKIECSAPSIIAFGDSVTSASDYMVVVEKENIFPLASVTTALHFCFASYYVFNISFPPQFRLVLLFLEKYIYSLKPSQKHPLSVTVLHDNLLKL